MRVRPFIRISGNLSMTTAISAPRFPPFNAQRMLSDVGAPSPAASDDANNADAAEPDAEVSFVTKDLAPILPKAKLAAVVAIDEVLMRVRDASNWRGNSGGVRYTALANATADASGAQPDLKMAYAAEGTTADPYAGFETRVVPEKRHAARQDQGSGHRRQSLRRNASTWSRRVTRSPRSCANRAPHRRSQHRSPPRSAPAAATAASRKARKSAS